MPDYGLPLGHSFTPAPPHAVTALTASAVSASEIDLAWSAAPLATYYEVERSTDGGSTWGTATEAQGLAYASTGLTALTAYTYRVRAKNASGTGPWSANASATTEAPPPPNGLLAGLVEHWPLTADAIGVVASTALDNGGSVTFHADGAHLNGTDQFLDIAELPSALRGGERSWAFACDVVFNDVSGWGALAVASGDYQIEMDPFGSGIQALIEYVFLADSPSSASVAADDIGIPSTATPYTVMCGHDNDARELWIRVGSGARKTVSTAGRTIFTEIGNQTPPDPLLFGTFDGAGGDMLNGALKNLTFWGGRTLSDADCTVLNNGGSGMLPYADFTA